MKKILFFAFTPFQTIAALAIRFRYYPDDQADIILADSVQTRDLLKTNIEKYQLFENVYFGNMNTFFPKNQNRIKHEWNRLKSAFCPYYIAKDIGFEDCAYDVYISTEINYYTESIYALVRKASPGVKVELMDEGYSSYTYFFKEAYKPSAGKERIKAALFKTPGYLIGRKFMARQAGAVYYFAPELLCWEEIPYEIKPVRVTDNSDFLEKMNQMFSYDELQKNGIEKEYERPYIYFEESFFCSRGNTNDMDIIEHIAEVVGKENMAVKLHPRNKVNRFKEKGYKTNETYGLPWEVVAANLDESIHRVFITFSSGAVLNYKFLCRKNFKTILLYKCIGDKYYHVEDSVKEWFEKFRRFYGTSVFIPETIQELDEYLKKWISEK